MDVGHGAAVERDAHKSQIASQVRRSDQPLSRRFLKWMSAHLDIVQITVSSLTADEIYECELWLRAVSDWLWMRTNHYNSVFEILKCVFLPNDDKAPMKFLYDSTESSEETILL